ncbi:MAG: sugar ABC transporter substrate-binding protein [Propionibacteriaceae bacterium]|nr:sugar ABC transporter substrate-binding protein [Propionibacteriaceae bacterium]
MKLIRPLAAMAAAVFALSACMPGTNSGDSSTGAMDTVNLWLPPLAEDNQDKAMWDNILAPFESVHNVNVEVTIVPWDNYETKYLTGVTSGNGPDVGYMYQEIIGDYTRRDLLVDLGPHLTDTQRQNLKYLDRGVFDGKQYAMPFVVGAARLLVHNKDILASAGVEVPKTWDEFLGVCQPLKDAGYVPLSTAWGDPSKGAMNNQFFPFVWQTGGELFTADGKDVLFDSPEVVRAAEYVKKLQDAGCIVDGATGMDEAAALEQFASGKAAFTVASEVKIPSFEGINVGYEVSLTDKQQGTFIALDSLVLLKQCKDPKLCAALIDFMTQGPQMGKFHAKASFPPIGNDEQSTFDQGLLDIYSNQADALHPLPVVPNGVGAYAALYKNLQQMLGGQKSPAQAMADAAAEGRQALES